MQPQWVVFPIFCRSAAAPEPVPIIAPAFIEELLARTDIVDVIGQYVPLKKTGANFVGLCPFHGEKSPSFSVSPTKQFFHCFGCGKSGDAIAFLREHNAVDFPEAVSQLAARAGMSVPAPEHQSPEQSRARALQKSRNEAIVDALDRALRSYRQQLAHSQRAIDYLRGRGVSPEIANHYLLGWAPEGWKHLASQFPDYASPTLVEAGLVITADDAEVASEGVRPDNTRRWDRFRERIMFPIRNVRGQCVGFGARVLGDAKPKYLNSPETPVFHKGRELYGLFEARAAIRAAGYVLVTEGYMDVVALAQWGFGQAVATLGTACTADHLRLVLRFTQQVVFCFDGDAAGRKAAERALHTALPFASDERSFRFAFLPPEHDPDSFIRSQGAAAFEQFIERALPLGEWLAQSAAAGCELNSSEGRAQLSARARPLWQMLPEGTLKRLLLGELAQRIHLSADELADIWQYNAERERVHAPKYPAQHPTQNPASKSNRSFTQPPPYSKTYSPQNPPRRADFRGAQHTAPQHTPRVRPSQNPAADQAVRILAGHMEFFAQLDADDMDALTSLNAPHGPLFIWLEAQWHENGPQNWALLNQKITAEIQNPVPNPHMGSLVYAQKIMDSRIANIMAANAQELYQELRSILATLLVARIKQLETQLLVRYAHDPSARDAYLALQERRKKLHAHNHSDRL